jgi:hypothetical protein
VAQGVAGACHVTISFLNKHDKPQPHRVYYLADCFLNLILFINPVLSICGIHRVELIIFAVQHHYSQIIQSRCMGYVCKDVFMFATCAFWSMSSNRMLYMWALFLWSSGTRLGHNDDKSISLMHYFI